MYTQHLEKIPVPEQPGFVTLRGPCFVTKEIHESPPVSLAALEAYESGTFAQVAFPDLPPEEPEFLISGTSPAGWRKAFG